MICLYHNDPDGKCAGAIVNRRYAVDNPRFIAVDYGKEPPMDLALEGEAVFVAVKLVSDCDCCIFSDERSRPFVCGLQLYDHGPKAEIWKELLDSSTTIPRLVQEGQTCLKFVERFGMDYGNKYGFETNFEGYRCFAQGLKWFGSRIDDYDICLFYAFLGDKWTVALLSNNPNIDVSAIAKKYGGGGHKGAAGFECDELPFVK